MWEKPVVENIDKNITEKEWFESKNIKEIK